MMAISAVVTSKMSKAPPRNPYMEYPKPIHTDDRQKYNSTKTTPNGTSPPIRITGMRLIYHGCGGISRGIADVATGGWNGSFFIPRNAPSTTNGSETPTQIATILRMERRGTAVVL